jgi:hypothetical protein
MSSFSEGLIDLRKMLAEKFLKKCQTVLRYRGAK